MGGLQQDAQQEMLLETIARDWLNDYSASMPCHVWLSSSLIYNGEQGSCRSGKPSLKERAEGHTARYEMWSRAWGFISLPQH